MVKLSDYLGRIISEVERARMQADLESQHLADLYAVKGSLLQYFPVPRFRIVSMKLDIPVAIRDDTSFLQNSNIIPNTSLETSRLAGLELNKVTSITVKEFYSKSKKSSIPLDNKKAQIEASLQRKINKFSLQGPMPVSVTYIVDELASTLRKELPPEVAEIERENFIVEFKESIRAKLLLIHPEAKSLDVLVDTAKLKEISSPEMLTRIDITIVEEGMEWRCSNDSKNTASWLRPE